VGSTELVKPDDDVVAPADKGVDGHPPPFSYTG
jgi:hypothetical protein